jgi:aryl-alcohol dehydrogenase-like predicted oxidoreductase
LEEMQQRRIGSGGFQVGAIGLGCMPMTWAYRESDRDDERSLATIRRALDLGVTLFDTADAYGPYTNELLVGRALHGRRDEVVIATKVGLIAHPELGMLRNGRPEHIRKACEASLRRLQVDCIDLYQLHRVDPNVPLEESWGTMADLVREGKVRALGLSEVSVDELSRAMSLFPVTTVQSELSLWTRDYLRTVVPWCAEYGVGFLAFAPLGRGYLTGRLSSETAFEARDFRARNPRFTAEAMAANKPIVEAVARVARRHKATPAQVALAWVLAVAEHVVPIPGTTRPGHVEENVAAVDLTLEPRDLDELAGLPAPEGARY